MTIELFLLNYLHSNKIAAWRARLSRNRSFVILKTNPRLLFMFPWVRNYTFTA